MVPSAPPKPRIRCQHCSCSECSRLLSAERAASWAAPFFFRLQSVGLEDLLDVAALDPHPASGQSFGYQGRFRDLRGGPQRLDQDLHGLLGRGRPQSPGDHPDHLCSSLHLSSGALGIGANVEVSALEWLPRYPTFPDQTQQRVVHAHAQHVPELRVGAAVRSILNLNGHGLLEGAGPRETDVPEKPQSQLVKVGAVGQRVKAARMGVARQVAQRREIAEQGSPRPAREPIPKRPHVEDLLATKHPLQPL